MKEKGDEEGEKGMGRKGVEENEGEGCEKE